MITAQEAEAEFAAPRSDGRVTPAARSLLHGMLFLTVLVSPLVFIEPSPYEFAGAVLAFVCVLAGVSLDRKLLPLAILLVVMNVGGAITLLSASEQSEALIYASTSLYLAVTAIVYACLFADDSLKRLELVRRAYLIAAFFACLAGIAGYFGLWPDGQLYGRARGTFKDPNVFGPFLVFPMLLVLQTIASRGVRLHSVAILGVFAFGLLLSFSRGAWAHFALSAVVLLALMLLTAPDVRTRLRLLLLSLASVVALASFVAVALSFDTLGDVFRERAKLTQSYDVGSGGRFDLQERAAGAVLENPAGMGPYGFERAYGGLQHNVYLHAFLVYGWVGGLAYVTLLLLTVAISLRLCFVPSPWRPYLVVALATFCGVLAEGLVIDTDHWRHFYLLLGLIWGLVTATINASSLGSEQQARQHAHFSR